MGMYTELHFNSRLKSNVPANVINILSGMTQGLPYNESESHPLFKTERWRFMLNCGSYYFDADTISTIRKDDITQQWTLCIRCNLKNYDDEIEKFLDWIHPYLDKQEGDFLGFYRYEETEQPTLIHYGLQQLKTTAIPDLP